MSVKAKLTLAVVACLAAATAVLGGVTVRSTRASLLAQVDDRLVEAATRVDREGFERRDRGRPDDDGEDDLGDLPEVGDLDRPGSGSGTDPRFREIAEIVYASDGGVLVAEPAGFPDDPEPYPDLPDVGTDVFEEQVDHIVTTPAVEGDLRYRVLTQRLGDGFVRVLATPLRDVDRASTHLIRTVLLTAVAVLLAGAAVSWWTIRRGLRPIDRMIDTASKIAAGDLSHRVDHRDDHSELGRLAHALDEMLAQLETAFSEREENQARLKRFVADASHELRTPVAAIRGYAELYEKGGLAEQETLERAMARIGSESIRMGRLVDDLLLLARLDQQQPLDLAEVDLAGIARDAVADLRAVDPDCPVTVDVRTEARVTGDEARLRQVITNLVGNARTHTPPGTAVRVTVDADERTALVTVADNGPGISVADQERIFERFYRADPSRSRRSGGTGLGLSIVAAVVAAHGGSVTVDSAPGEGARFTARLPVAGPRDPQPGPEAGSAPGGGGDPAAEPETVPG